MKEMVRSLDRATWPAVISYIKTLKELPAGRTLAGNVERGKTVYASCATCHGGRGEGIERMNAPKLVILEDWYVARQLENFMTGTRGATPGDAPGAQMRAAAMVLRGAQDVADVASFIASVGLDVARP
jgi:cytochrome c oxidase subunit 2